MRKAAVAVLLLATLASCNHLPKPGRAPEGPEVLEGARYIGQTWCSDKESGARKLWRCRIYERGDRTIVSFVHAISGELLALGDLIGDGPQVWIFWRASAEATEPPRRMEL